MTWIKQGKQLRERMLERKREKQLEEALNEILLGQKRIWEIPVQLRRAHAREFYIYCFRVARGFRAHGDWTAGKQRFEEDYAFLEREITEENDPELKEKLLHAYQRMTCMGYEISYLLL